ncbi:MAG: gamma-glutamylcyclotransferase [Myxococcales bacterium]|nr:gamma-glutamylcyclotransferase [Myxococcales bacterium]
MSESRHRLFVYGNLLPGEPEHHLLSESEHKAQIEHVGPARTASGHKLVERGTFAALVVGGLDRVVGELYLVPTQVLGKLDLAKEHPRLFERRTITLEDGSEAQAYTLSVEQARGLRRVRHGDWRNRFKADGPEAGPFVRWAKNRYSR